MKYFINIISLVLGIRKANYNASTPKIIKFRKIILWLYSIITKFSRRYFVLYRCHYSFKYCVLTYFTQKKIYAVFELVLYPNVLYTVLFRWSANNLTLIRKLLTSFLKKRFFKTFKGLFLCMKSVSQRFCCGNHHSIFFL